jgi:hypothetical protein
MEKEFVPYTLALELRELGFDEPCFAYYGLNNVEDKLFFDIDPDDGELTSLNQNQFYHNNLSEVGKISAPLKQQVFKFFREIYAISFFIIDIYPAEYQLNIHNGSNYEQTEFETYEEAESACIDKLIEIVKNI